MEHTEQQMENSEQGTRLLPWSPQTAVAVTVLIYLLTSQLIGPVIITIYGALRQWSQAHIESWSTHSTFAQFFYVLVVEASTVGLLYLYLKRHRVPFSVLGLVRPRLLDLGKSLLALPVYFGLYLGALTLATKLFPSLNVNQEQQLGFNAVQGSTDLVLTFLSLVVLPPLVEELVMRGFLFTSLRSRLKFVWAALITSVLFAVAHLQFGSSAPLLWVAAIDTFALSLVLCYLRDRTGSLWPGIGLHALKNSIAFVSIFILHVH